MQSEQRQHTDVARPGAPPRGARRAGASSVSLPVVAKRRRRVWRAVGFIVAGTAAMVVLAAINRDHQDVRGCRTTLEAAVKVFGERTSTMLPRAFPVGDRAGLNPARHYYYVPDALFLEHGRGDIGVCCCAMPHRLFFQDDGRHVVVFNNGEFRVRWLTESQFQREKDVLRLRVLPAP